MSKLTFSAFQLIIDEKAPSIGEFLEYKEEQYDTKDNIYRITTQKIDNTYYWIYMEYGGELPYGEKVYDKEKSEILNNPRTKSQAEVNKQLFCLYDFEQHAFYVSDGRKKGFLEEYLVLENDDYREFKTNYTSGQNTYTRMTSAGIEIEEEQFNELEKELKKEKLFAGLFSPIVTFQEVINYCNYMSEKIEYITMHKTKGSGIENVIVVLDEYFWNEYDFSKFFDTTINDTKKIASQKLFYVACSRTEKNLTCVKLITQDEESLIRNFFSNSRHLDLNSI